jgi:rod shape-determining protein MreB
LAGDKFDDDIIQWAQSEFNLLIGPRMAEKVKIQVGSALPLREKREVAMRGRNLITGLPEEIMVSNEEVKEALKKSVEQVVQGIKDTIEETPPELLADIMRTGIHFCGGGSLLRGLPALVQKETKIPTRLVEDPMTAVVRGAGAILEDLDDYHDVLVETEQLEVPK